MLSEVADAAGRVAICSSDVEEDMERVCVVDFRGRIDSLVILGEDLGTCR